ncbi:zinc ribbon domain-containing protein [Herbidospora mongoliensis]|uniref:zinc ribbon domain-containing protein n=1 Tax=Herbidospora mongoliensis TaxID=688067 RepID=UPI00082DDC2D|nr:zinc ribbon domain-containing protein [Herbidospora mongoliensis]
MSESAVSVLLSPLLNSDELGSLAEVLITFEVNRSGRAHSPTCRRRGKSAGGGTVGIGEFRLQGHHIRACRMCGGGDLVEPTPDQAAVAQRLATLLPGREEEARRQRESERAAAARRRSADAVDKRAGNVLDEWSWRVDEERLRLRDEPARELTVTTTCAGRDECGADADLLIDTRTLKMRFRCHADSAHGRREIGGELEDIWMYGEPTRYDALALIVTVIAGDDDAWKEVYGTRAQDYRSTVAALRSFDEANPPPLDLGVNVRCGICDRRMSFHEAIPDSKIKAAYYCDVRHSDGRYHRVYKEEIDVAVGRHLRLELRGRSHWVVAPELAPEPESVAAYADRLAAKIQVFDRHIGAAGSDESLGRERALLVSRLAQARDIQERGVFAAAGLDSYWHGDQTTELGRALLIDRVGCDRAGIDVVSHFEEGTDLYRRLRTEELTGEINGLRAHLSALEEELDELSA